MRSLPGKKMKRVLPILWSISDENEQLKALLEKAKCCGSCWFWYSLGGVYDCRWDPDECPGIDAYEGPCEAWVARDKLVEARE